MSNEVYISEEKPILNVLRGHCFQIESVFLDDGRGIGVVRAVDI